MLDPATPLARVAVHGRDAAVGDGAREHAPPAGVASAIAQLEATLAETAAATNRILGICEMLDDVAARLAPLRSAEARAAAGELQIATRALYEACGFQDLTGQRITKVAGTVGAIERLLDFMVVLGYGPKAEGRGASETGPQTPASAMGQADVDRLLSALE